MPCQALYLPPHRTAPWDLPLALEELSLGELSFKHFSLETARSEFKPFTSPIPPRPPGHLHIDQNVYETAFSPHEGHGQEKGRGEVRTPPSDNESESASRILGVIEETAEEDDLNIASAHYSQSTILARKHGPLIDRISCPVAQGFGSSPPPDPRPTPALIDRIGPALYVPPIRRRYPPILPIRPPSRPRFAAALGGTWTPHSNRNFRSPALSPDWRLPLAPFQTDPPDPERRSGPSRPYMGRPSYAEVAACFHELGDVAIYLHARDLVVRMNERVEGVRYVGSYKWIDGEEGVPTLAVPAVPDIWDPPRRIGQLALDKDMPYYEEFPDYTSALLPPSLSTLEPLFLSLEKPGLVANIDLVTGRNNLRKLWSALNPEDNHHTRPFRIDIELSPDPSGKGGIVLLERWEPPQRRNCHRESPGYHLAYHEASTKKVLVGSDRTPGCNRVISYSFGGLGMLVKYDISAYIPSADDENYKVGNDWDQESLFMVDDRDTETTLSECMEGLDFDDPVYDGQAIQVKHTNLIPPHQSSLVAIKTKTHLHDFDEDYHFSQMYFSQTTHLIYARHKHGDFDMPSKPRREYNIINGLMVARHQAGIDRMGAMLRWVVGLSKEHRRGLALVWDGDTFAVCDREGGPQLSGPVKEMIAEMR